MLVHEKEEWSSRVKDLNYETPFKLTDTTKAQNNVKVLKKLFPRIDIFYAIKSNPSVELIQAIDELVDGYDIASYGEFSDLVSLGIDPKRMLFSNPVKVPEHIRKTAQEGLEYYVFDSEEEVRKLASHASGANVYLRLNVSNQGSRLELSSKFGADFADAVRLMKMAQEEGLHPRGLAFHVGSQAESAKTWIAAIEQSGALIKDLDVEGIAIEMLDVGGGFPAVYENAIPIQQMAETINQALATYIPAHIRVVSEPGRAVSATTSVIVASVIGKAQRGDAPWLYLDMGVFQGLTEVLEVDDWRFPIFPLQGKDEPQQSFVLTGPTCDSCDTIGRDYLLPADIKVGDKVIIGSAGAYTTEYAARYFNGFTPPRTYFIESTD